MDTTAVLGKRGRLTVPTELRTSLGLVEGDVLHVERVGTKLVFEKRTDAASELRGILAERSSGRSLIEELLDERAAEVRADG